MAVAFTQNCVINYIQLTHKKHYIAGVAKPALCMSRIS